MDARHERGLQLAQRGDIVKHANGWKVRSQSGNGSYFVHLEDNPSCTCHDFLCKVLCHNLCVIIQVIHELGIDPTFGAERLVAPKVVEK